MPVIKKLVITAGLLLPIAVYANEQSRSFSEFKQPPQISNTFRVSFADMLTPDDAKSMSQRAAELINQKGTLGISDFSQIDGGFLMKDGYVFCMSMKAVMISHPIRNQLVGQNLYHYQRYGQPFFKQMVEVAERDGEGWVEYRWPYPGTTELRLKMSYVVKNEAGFFCGVSAFK